MYLTEGNVVAWFVDGTEIIGASDNYIIDPAIGGYFAQVVDSNGCIYIAKAYTVTGVLQPKLLQGIQVYPNPTKDMLTITGTPIGTELMITDILGKRFEVSSHDMSENGTITLKLDQLPGQMYFLQIVSGESRYICKVFITQ